MASADQPDWAAAEGEVDAGVDPRRLLPSDGVDRAAADSDAVAGHAATDFDAVVGHAAADSDAVAGHAATRNLDAAAVAAQGDRMPLWIRRALFWFFGGVIALYILRSLASSLSSLLILVFASLFFSFALEPAVNRLELMGVKRGLGTFITFVLALVSVGGFGFLIGSVLATQITDLVDIAPVRIASLETWLQDHVDDGIDLSDLSNEFVETGGVGEQLTGVAGDLVGFGTTAVNLLFDLFTVGLFTFYLVADGPRFRRTLCSVFPPERQRTVLVVWDIAVEKTGGYIVSRLILAAFAAIFHWLVFLALGVPFPLALAIWMGVISQFIPVVGTYLAGALPVLISMLDNPTTGLWVLIVVLVYQQIENYLFAPRITAQTMEIHPAVAFGSVLAGAAVLGPIGALLALPAAATIQGFLSSYLSYYDVVSVNVAELPELETPRPRMRLFGRGG